MPNQGWFDKRSGTNKANFDSSSRSSGWFDAIFHDGVGGGSTTATRTRITCVFPGKRVGAAVLAMACMASPLVLLASVAQAAPFRQASWPNPAHRLSTLSISTSTRPSDVPAVQPFRQSNWPTPHGKPTAISLRTHTQAVNPLLVGVAPFRQRDWPTPVRGLSTLSITTSTRPSDVPGAAPFRQVLWPNPSRGLSTLTITTSTRPSDVPAVQPFAQASWPNPPRRLSTLSITTSTRPSDAPAAAPFWQASWQLPLRRFSLQITLSARPSEASATEPEVVPFRLSEWPSPQGRAFPIGLRTWTQTRPIFAQDLQPFDQTDWPPGRAVPPVRILTTWTSAAQQGPLSLTVAPIPPGESQQALPISRAPAASLKTWTLSLQQSTLAPAAGAAPFRPVSWPNPVLGKISPITSRWFTYYYVYDTSSPFLSVTTPTPPSKASSLNLRTWTTNLLTSTLGTPPSTLPFRQSTWPNPTHKGSLVSLWTQTNTRQAFHVDLQPFAQEDWPNPRVGGRSLDLCTWTQNLQQSTLGLPIITTPFAQAEWPNPIGKPHPVSLRTQVNVRQAFHVDLQPFDQVDWPNPRLPGRSLDLRTWGQNLSEGTLGPQPVPFSLDEWPNPRGKGFPIQQRTWTKARALGIIEPLPFRQRAWPNPLEPKVLATLRTWTAGEWGLIRDTIPALIAGSIDLPASAGPTALFASAGPTDLPASAGPINLTASIDG